MGQESGRGHGVRELFHVRGGLPVCSCCIFPAGSMCTHSRPPHSAPQVGGGKAANEALISGASGGLQVHRFTHICPPHTHPQAVQQGEAAGEARAQAAVLPDRWAYFVRAEVGGRQGTSGQAPPWQLEST